MTKVRIGNDIRMVVYLLADDDSTLANIKSLRAYLINTTRQNDIDDQHRRDSINYANDIEERNGVVKYISRFPAEPCCGNYNSSPYDLMHCGHPSYYVRPMHCVAPYTGFGVYPHTFDPFRNQLWAYDDNSDLHNKMLYKELEYKREYQSCEFLAPVSFAEDRGKVYVDFPAESQLYIGEYKLIIVAKVYEPGYSTTNLKTITMDYNYVFELVKSSDESGVHGGTTINIGSGIQPTGVDITAPSTIYLNTPTELFASIRPLGASGNVKWEVENIVGEDGIHVPNDSVIINSSNSTGRASITARLEAANSTVTIKASSASNPDVYTTFKMRVSDHAIEDDYVNSGEFNENDRHLTLTRLSGDQVDFEIPSEVKWFNLLDDDVIV